MSLTVCQSHPSSSATSLTVRPLRPTSSVTQSAALRVSFIRGCALRSSCSVQLPLPQSSSSQRHRRLCQYSADVRAPKGLSLIHISEPTRQAEISYAVFCLKKKKKK